MENPNVDEMPRRAKPKATSLALSVRQACDLLGFGRTTFYRAIREGRLPAKKWGGRTIVLRSDLEQFLNELPDHDQAPK